MPQSSAPRETLVKVEKPDWLEQMEGILETLNEGVLIADDCQRILFVNETFERLVDRPRAAVVGKTPDAFYHGEDLERLQRERARGLELGRNRHESFLPRPDGTRVPVVVSSRVIEDPDGRMFAVVTFTDISEQKKAEQSLRDANVQLERRAEEIDRELALASRVQQSLAPQALQWGHVNVETYYMPVRTIGGDFGLVVPHLNAHLDLLICDVSGHGISSALLANRIYTETTSLLRRGVHLGEMLRKLNSFVVQQIGISGFMFTLAAARLDHAGRKLSYAAAGHPPALLISPSGEVRQLEARSTVLGAIEDAVPEPASDDYNLSSGDRLMLYSDGLTEVWDREEEMLGIEGLADIARKASALPLSAMRAAIIEGVNSYSAEPVHDDVSLVLVEVA
jgi:phosphoserine phosphatase RsbU/P